MTHLAKLSSEDLLVFQANILAPEEDDASLTHCKLDMYGR